MSAASLIESSSGGSAQSAADELTVVEAMALLARGDKEILFADNHIRAIPVLGDTGSAKTTSTIYITGGTLQCYESPPGGNQYLVQDPDQLISDATIVSQTVFPRMFTDPETGEALWDCPGFADTRKVSIEIANTYFIKKVVEHSEEMKILLVAPYSSVCSGQDRRAFIALMDLMLQFLKKPENFSSGVALLVTKVSNTNQSDAQVILTVADFLSKFRNDLNNVEFAHDRANVDQLLDALLTFDENATEAERYPNIAIFRQPVGAGNLYDLPGMPETRKRIRKMLFQNEHFKYQPIQSSTFGFSLSPQAQLVSYSLVVKFKEEAESKLDDVKAGLTKVFEEFLMVERSVTETKSLFDKPREVIARVIDINNIWKLTTDYEDALKKIGIAPPYNMFGDILKFVRFTQFLEEHRSDTNLEGATGLICKKTYETLVCATEIFGRCCVKAILNHLLEQFNEGYDSKLQIMPSFEQLVSKVAKDIERFDNLKLSGSQISFNKSIDLLEEVFSQAELDDCKESTNFLHHYCGFYSAVVAPILGDLSGRKEMQQHFNMTVQNMATNLKSVPLLFENLKSLLNDRINTGWNFDPADKLSSNVPCAEKTKVRLRNDLRKLKEGSKMRRFDGSNCVIIEGHVISSTEVLHFLKSEQYVQVLLLATIAVKLDADLILRGKNLLIIAPKLVVSGSRQISLEGIHGVSYANAAKIGQSGESGGNGGNGGHFTAAVLEIENPNFLKISVDGGNGGNGQDGGVGNEPNDPQLKGADLEHHEVSPVGSEAITSSYEVISVGGSASDRHFLALGQPGKQGKVGGCGGAGGNGGGAGTINFLSPKDVSSVIKSAKPGVPGNGGLGGAGGPGGQYGAGRSVRKEFDRHRSVHKGGGWNFVRGKTIVKTDVGGMFVGLERISSDRFGPNGSAGASGPSGSVSASVALPNSQYHVNYSKGLEIFKTFLQQFEQNLFLYEKIQEILRNFPTSEI